MTLIDQLQSQLQKLPPELSENVQAKLQQWDEQTALLTTVPDYPELLLASWVKVWTSSLFVADSCIRRPEMLFDLIESDELFKAYAETQYAEKLSKLTDESEAELMVSLRRLRNREMVRIAWRDLAGWATLEETLHELTWLAEACIRFVLDFLYRQACDKFGTPMLTSGQAQQMVVLGMGKLGAYELNYSSDIDLIFAFAEDGVLSDRKQTTYGEFFSKICRKLVKMLDETTADGFVFRTDIRLRPFGDSGPVIMNFDGMENYYLTQAREWERYAMIKARQVAGDEYTGPQLMKMLHAFVYRRYLDYGAFEELRSLKYKITQELQRKDRLDNIKLGPGGIREIEFIGQAFQLIRGGQEKSLQNRRILEVLQRLGEMELLAPQDAEQLIGHYRFLREAENHIQQYQDRQTHDLPQDPPVQLILAYSMGFSDWPQFKAKLDDIRRQVHDEFDLVFSLSKQDKRNLEAESIWAGHADDEELCLQLLDLGFSSAEEILLQIREFKKSPAVKRLTAKGAAVLDRLMPQLLESVRQVENPDETLKRLLRLFEAVAGRNVYLSLLYENPEALTQLVKLSAASPWICDYLAHYPVLFDELLDTRSLYEPLKKQALQAELAEMLADINIQDTEQLMMVLRKFKHINLLRVAAADIMGIIPIMVVSDYLTYIAETIVERTVSLCWRIMTDKHGAPPNTDNVSIGFGVLGFGKLGGIELGYGSDLDMVFLYDSKDTHALTDGAKPISCSHFYGRLGQKVMQMLNTRLLSGILYEVDMRLRPSGNAGLLVNHVDVYEDYLRDNAWTWEHQALVRGRFIAGDPAIKTEFEAIRNRILCMPRDHYSLKKEVREMREKMRENLDTTKAGEFDLKQSKGGIADIEFIVQFCILDQAAANGSLVTYTDNVRLLDGLAQIGTLSEPVTEQLKRAYCCYRDYGHKQALQGDKAVASEEDFAVLRAHVERIWQQVME
ncbi:bifunctional [glutamate--ammonia ligase]-adenylyl-L-tyrosine phosphorylase/[glutamate--ammonia-ligase] adenylyltransferase [Methylotuvimicrobium buryatense]|uniref:Bifunctional glutamine synthetase adenylyltransferase/adenylyl-removing enzyme n=1 Tax=Methylotuvimicrobium buryatense TaxID=95641 RepID=A0A4V1IJN6_METBY|nr:bifunctional [glutamate--ammonia ligase]-adenylyl-L-tyrosine phosphorylase/[glutamate--ammonia-ligase] adenylyltransferase [Methylotuvimicrobium buryatense]QCW82035.1 bifunctional [glutamate--ammonia ligase]-adenylyl-L-tyrosine phosphorylase/[glutamate--ammonia-ligase] adenylyltransferase [Methylotuvimicrobium buryatense]